MKAAVHRLGEGLLFTFAMIGMRPLINDLVLRWQGPLTHLASERRLHVTCMTYVYLIESANLRQQHYVGITRDLKQRLTDHNEAKSHHTRKFKPWNLIASMGFADEKTAHAFEKYLKTGSGKTFLKRHLVGPPLPYDPPPLLTRLTAGDF